MTPRKDAPSPRHRPRLRGYRLATIRLAVCTRQDFACAIPACRRAFPHPEGWDGSYALFITEKRTPDGASPLPFKVIRLELDHVKDDPMRPGPWTPEDFQGLCSPCNRSKPRPGGTQ